MSAARWTAAEALPGRDRPDASEAPSGRVEAGLILNELEQRGLWVRVETPDEKRFWVDGRRLQAVALADEPDRPQSQTHQQADPVPPQPAPKPAAPPPQAPVPPQDPTPVWTATHTVPAGGLPAWAQPDPAGAVIANLAARVQLRVIERRGDWAHVDAENGRKAWVDGRRLVAAHVVAPQAVAPVAAAGDKPVPTKRISLRSVAAFAVLISAFLPWIGPIDTSASDVPAAFLWSPYADLSFPNMGTVMFVVGAAVLTTEFVDRFKPYRRIAAGVAVGVVALFLVQLFRVMLDYESQFTTAVATMFTEEFAIGPWVALAAGITLLVKRETKPGGNGA